MKKLMLLCAVGTFVLMQVACTTSRRVHAPEPIVPKGLPFVEKAYNDVASIDVDSAVFPVSPRILMIPDSDYDGVNDETDKCPGTVEKSKVDRSGCPLDSDKDGVSDGQDKCANTPANSKVDGAGCPVDGDIDKDGIKDAVDKCPGTPANTKVDGNGCAFPLAPASAATPVGRNNDGGGWSKNQGGVNSAGGNGQPVMVTVNNYINGVKVNDQEPLVRTVKITEPQLINPVQEDQDSDQDGVQDKRDKCPTTPTDAKVDVLGCPLLLEDVAIDLKVLFATDQAIILDKAYEDILKVADFMRKYPTVELVVEGHTDSRASTIHNQKLSERRARAVMRELIHYGVDGARLRAVGYGELRPIADNDTEEGRARNRRVTATAKSQIMKK